MRPSASFAARASALAAAALLTFATVAPQDAEARAGRGMSYGNRGARTYDAPPPTATMPGAAPMQRSTQSGQYGAPSSMGAQSQRSGGLFGGRMGGLGAGLMGGLLGAGLFGLLSGGGFFNGLGSIAGFLGLLIQLAIIFFVARFALNWWRNRQSSQTATAGAGPQGYGYQPQSVPPASDAAYSRTGYDAGSSGSSRYDFGRAGYGTPPGRGQDDVPIETEDYEAWERLLSEVQEAWSRQDLGRLRGLVTPEMAEIFSEDLADDASNGVFNEVSGVKLLQGDLAEAWSEGSREFASVAMRYALVDKTIDRSSGRIVEGSETPTEASEMWTFVRSGRNGSWLLSAIQQAA